jgi:pyruvate kinase
MSRRAKIVCTIGPATATPDRIKALVEAGMDVARLNFSHGGHDDHAKAYEMVRAASDLTGRAVSVLADLQGPKIRLGNFLGGGTEWATGETVTITGQHVEGTHDLVSTTYGRLAEEVKVGNRLLVDDGKLALEVTDVHPPTVQCLVLEGGAVSDHKGLSLPNATLSVPALSEKDIEDLRFALGLRVDLVALSFVRSPKDIVPVREIMDRMKARVPVLAKLEKPEAVDHLDEIVAAFDGLMVARGDLGVELPLEQVPMVQKRAVQLCRENAKPVIVATQMLESMVTNSRPTRAEASDVANAVLDGTDALMLSGETSVGSYPVLAASTMARIISSVENGMLRPDTPGVPPLQHAPRSRGGAIAAAARQIADQLSCDALVAFTVTGDTVRRLARLHPNQPLLAFTPEPSVRSQLALSWGVETFLSPYVKHTDDMVEAVDSALLDLGRFAVGETVVVVAGSPPGTAGSTNAIRVHQLGSLHPVGTRLIDGSKPVGSLLP